MSVGNVILPQGSGYPYSLSSSVMSSAPMTRAFSFAPGDDVALTSYINNLVDWN